MTTQAVLYARFSPQPAAKMAAKEACAIPDQFGACREFCARQGLQVVGEFFDLGDDPPDEGTLAALCGTAFFASMRSAAGVGGEE